MTFDDTTLCSWLFRRWSFVTPLIKRPGNVIILAPNDKTVISSPDRVIGFAIKTNLQDEVKCLGLQLDPMNKSYSLMFRSYVPNK